MVEMLGVLAIIGVLSVGAIAGYSKAMMKYKLNNQAEGFSSLLNEAIKIKEEMWERLLKNGGNLSSEILRILYKTNSIPDTFSYVENDGIYDTFKNKITIFCYSVANSYAEYMLSYHMTNSTYSTDICRNLVTASKENAADIYFLQMRSASTLLLYGDKRCNGSNCLRNADIQEIDKFCSSCTEGSDCNLFFYLDLTNL